MATSGSTNYTATRDDIITRALRNINELGTGETASTTRLAECAMALNMLVKEWQAQGMQLWKQQTVQITPLVAGTSTYTIGLGATVNTVAPTRVMQAWRRITVTGADSPILIQTKSEYDMYSNKSTSGTPNILFYNPPGATTGEMQGTIYLFNPPDATFVANQSIWVTGMFPIEDFDTSTDNPDFPSYYYNALVWGLADQLCYESGLPLSERAMIAKKAQQHLEVAQGLDQEEGSIRFGINYWG